MLGLSVGNMYRGRETDATRPIYNKNGKGRWGVNESTLRLRRADDDFEKEFDPLSGRVLDVDSITNFHSWNWLNGAEYKDYLYDVPLGVDSDDDGVSDGWLGNSVGSGITAINYVEDGFQVKEITEALNAGDANIITESASLIPATEGDIFSFKADSYLNFTNGGRITLQITYYDVTNSVLGTDFENYTNTELQTNTVIGTGAPANTSYIKMFLKTRSLNAGSVGKGYFKNAVLVKNSFIEDIGLLTQDDDSDGVANEWGSFIGSGITGAFSIDGDNGQKFEITNSSTTSTSYVLQFGGSGFPAKEGDVFKCTFESKFSNNARGYVSVFFRNSSGTVIGLSESSNVSNTEFQSYSIDTIPAPAGTVEVTLGLRTRPINIGDTGSGWYRNATLKQTNNSVYCTKKFDKTGNGNHAVQTTATEQPRLVNAGVFETNSAGKYSLYYDGVDDHFDVTDNQGLDITSGGLSILAEHDPDAQNGYIVSRNQPVLQYGLFTSSAGATSIFLEDASRSTESIAGLNSKITVGTYDFINSKIYLDGTLSDSDPLSTALTSSPYIQIGCRSNSADGLTKTAFYKGHITNIAIFNKALTQPQITLLYNRLNAIGGA